MRSFKEKAFRTNRQFNPNLGGGGGGGGGGGVCGGGRGGGGGL